MQLLKLQFFLSNANEKRECNFSDLFGSDEKKKISKQRKQMQICKIWGDVLQKYEQTKINAGKALTRCVANVGKMTATHVDNAV